jgi:hypothetical protein
MNAHVRPQPIDKEQREFVLASLRIVVRQLDLLREEVAWHGVSLANGVICPQTAIRWTEEVAPGCLPLEVKATFIAKGWNLS